MIYGNIAAHAETTRLRSVSEIWEMSGMANYDSMMITANLVSESATIIHEGVGSFLKKFFEGLVNLIKKLWNAVIEAVKSFFALFKKKTEEAKEEQKKAENKAADASNKPEEKKIPKFSTIMKNYWVMLEKMNYNVDAIESCFSGLQNAVVVSCNGIITTSTSMIKRAQTLEPHSKAANDYANKSDHSYELISKRFEESLDKACSSLIKFISGGYNNYFSKNKSDETGSVKDKDLTSIVSDLCSYIKKYEEETPDITITSIEQFKSTANSVSIDTVQKDMGRARNEVSKFSSQAKKNIESASKRLEEFYRKMDQKGYIPKNEGGEEALRESTNEYPRLYPVLSRYL